MKANWTAWLAVVGFALHAGCGATAGTGGGGGVALKDAGAGDALVAIDTASDLAAADEAAGVDVAEDVAQDVAEDVAPDVAQDVQTVPNTNGEYLQPPLDAPAFTKVVDFQGAKVTPDALQGHYTVLWFYPAASTAG